MDAASLIAIDLAKNVFHLHGVSADGPPPWLPVSLANRMATASAAR